jgi:hypothetical protein
MTQGLNIQAEQYQMPALPYNAFHAMLRKTSAFQISAEQDRLC